MMTLRYGVILLQIFMWNFKDNKDLVGVAFIDTEIYSHRAVSLKNFVVIGDVHYSIQLLKYKVSATYLMSCKMKKFVAIDDSV